MSEFEIPPPSPERRHAKAPAHDSAALTPELTSALVLNSSPLIDSAPAPLAAAPDQPRGAVEMAHAFRRHWMLALAVGLLCGGGIAVAIWTNWTPTYVSSAQLRVASRQPVVMFKTADVDEQPTFDIYKRTQRALVLNRFVLNAALRRSEVTQLPVVQAHLDPAEWLQRQLNVTFPDDAEILEISMRGDNPEALATLVNAVCDEYVEGVVHAARNDRLARLQSLEKIYNDAEEKVRQKRADLRQLAETLGTGNSQTATLKQQIAMENYGFMRKQQLGVQYELLTAQSKLASQKSRLSSLGKEKVPSDILDEEIQLHPEYLAASKQVNRVRESALDSEILSPHERQQERYHRDADAAQQKLDDLRKRLEPAVEAELRKKLALQYQAEIAKTDAELAILSFQNQRLEQEVGKFQQEAQQIGRSSVDLEMMRSEIDNVDKIRNEMAQEIESLKVELASSSRVEVINRAEVPRFQDDKARVRNTVLLGAVAFLAPVFGICWWDARRKRVNNVQEVTGAMRLPLLGTVPRLPARVYRQLPDSEHRSIWGSMMSESVDSIRELLIRAGRARPAKVLFVTSAMSREGKTTLAAQLAISFARTDKRVVLVDFDLRRPATNDAFGEAQASGIAEVLAKTNELNEVIRPTACPNLYYVQAGAIDEQSPKLLSTGKQDLRGIFDKLREQFDVVVVDSCPVLPVADSLIVGQFADFAVLAVMCDVSESHRVLEARERLERMGIPVFGAVVTSKAPGIYASKYGYSSASSEYLGV